MINHGWVEVICVGNGGNVIQLATHVQMHNCKWILFEAFLVQTEHKMFIHYKSWLGGNNMWEMVEMSFNKQTILNAQL